MSLLIGISYIPVLSVSAQHGNECENSFLSEVKKGDVLLDFQMGLLRLMSHDREKDEVVVRFADVHKNYAIKPGTLGNRSRRKLIWSDAPFKLISASQRMLATVPGEASTEIALSRAREFAGLNRSALFFAVNAIASRAEYPTPESEWWIQTIWNPIAEQFLKPSMDINWRTFSPDIQMMHLLLAVSDLKTKDTFPALNAAINAVYKVTGENLIRSGLLVDYSRHYTRNWRLKGFKRWDSNFVTKKWFKNEYFVPQDIDHFVHSYLWNRSAQMFDLYGFESATLTDAVVLQYKRVNKLVEDWIPPGESSVWRDIFDMAGTVVVTNENEIRGHTVVINKTRDMSEYLLCELIRVSYNQGATKTLVVPKHP